MKTKRNTKIAFLIGAIIMFIMIPVYYSTMVASTGWERWLPILLFLTIGILCLINYFIMQMEQAQNNGG